jgi:hypothetical protein
MVDERRAYYKIKAKQFSVAGEHPVPNLALNRKGRHAARFPHASVRPAG